MYKFRKNRNESDGLTIGVQPEVQTPEGDLFDSERSKGNCQVRINFQDVFGFAELRKIATYCIGDNLTKQIVTIMF